MRAQKDRAIMYESVGSSCEDQPVLHPAQKTARWRVVHELKSRGTARNIDLARALDLRPSTVGYVLYQLRIAGCAKRLGTGLYQFVRMPENLHFWDDGLAEQAPEPSGDTMPEQILHLLRQAPKGALSFRAIWKLSGLPRNVTGAVLSDLVKRGLVDRVRRGLYRPAEDDSAQTRA